MRILLIEDDDTLGEGLTETLGLDGHRVDWLDHGTSAAHAFDADVFDAAILDLALPGLDGEQVLSHWRRAGVTTPVLVLTAHETSRDCVALLDAGADDYVVKPARVTEIEARLRALVRRGVGRIDETLSCGALTLSVARRAAWQGTQRLTLSAYEFVVLQALVEHAGDPVTRERLEALLYGWSDGPESNSLEVLIHRLRQKLGAASITTVRNVGYRIAT
ncbi:response regulator [Salinisphaera sp. Q1T1-3]|uniref:response regulator n=1 Tax=Salinisphaera sp. Q1T1-3 TaxID=2321229 RepID=UPI000E70FDF5|nr:response regulator [Salinisphaera sp. Q1T1-3]RJS94076.1 response regulator [Salinisphaera sp. Q1T1-3]